MLTIFALVGFILVVLSFATWSRPSTLGLTQASDSYKSARGIAFGLWTLALPAYSLWEWYFFYDRHLPTNAADVANFNYGNQVWSNVWSAVAVLLGLLFGIKK
jgi:hypothetical protein